MADNEDDLEERVEPGARGVIYMGPALSDEEEAEIRRRPSGTRIMPPAPVGAPAMAAQDERAAALSAVPGARTMEDVGLWNRVAATDTATSHTLPGVSRPPVLTPEQQFMDYAQTSGQPLGQVIQVIDAQRRYQAQRGYQSDLAAGMSAADAMTKWGPMLFTGPRGAAAMPRPAPISGSGPNTYRDPTGNTYYWTGSRWIHVPNPAQRPVPMDTITEKIPGTTGTEAVPGLPAVPPKRILGIPIPLTGSPAVAPIPGVPGTPSRTVTRRVPAGTSVAEPTPRTQNQSASGKRVRVRNPAGKVGTIPEDQVEDAKASGWTVL